MDRYRQSMALNIRSINQNERKITVSFSSEKPVMRYDGKEILCHDNGCVDLKRLNSIGISLWNHHRDIVIGKIRNAYLDSTAKRCYCEIIFDDDEQSEKIYQKVLSGTLKGVSVGYRITEWEVVANGKTSSNGRFKGPCNIAKRWYPYEVSIVSVPADDDVGINRAANNMSLQLAELQVQINKNRVKGIL